MLLYLFISSKKELNAFMQFLSFFKFFSKILLNNKDIFSSNLVEVKLLLEEYIIIYFISDNISLVL